MPVPIAPDLSAAVARVELQPPDVIRVGQQSVRVGGTTYRAVAALVSQRAARAGGLSVEQFRAAVWGQRDVGAGTVRVCVSRASAVLRGLGSDVGASVCDGRVVLTAAG